MSDPSPKPTVRQPGPVWYRAAVRTAAVAAVFCLAVLLVLIVTHIRSRELDPINNAQMAALKLQAVRSPDDQALKQRVRALDLKLRQAYFHNNEFSRRGAYLLLAGAVVFLAAVGYAAACRQKAPMPRGERTRGEDRRGAARARWSVAGVAILLLGTGLAAGLILSRPSEVAPDKTANAAQNWPRFRGPGGLGVSAYTNVPDRWNGATGENILWKTPIPLPGENSPIAWGNRVFLSGATENRREVYCFDADDGRLLWRRTVENVPNSPTEVPKVMALTGYAAPTMATDGERVFAIFANGDLAAFDFDGQPLWAVNLGLPDNHYGHASSLATYKRLLIVQYDQGSKGTNKSAILALNVVTGSTVWRAYRTVPMSWPSPIVVESGGRDQLIACGDPWVIAYDPNTGNEIWRADWVGDANVELAPSPAFADGVVFAAQDNACLAAIRTDGSGDVTGTKVLWRSREKLPDTCSVLATGDLVFTIAYTTMNCFDARTGKLLWQHDLPDECRASPSLVGDRVYQMDVQGIMHILDAARTFKLLGTAELGEESNTSPAFMDGRIYIRGKHHLFCIGRPNAEN